MQCILPRFLIIALVELTYLRALIGECSQHGSNRALRSSDNEHEASMLPLYYLLGSPPPSYCKIVTNLKREYCDTCSNWTKNVSSLKYRDAAPN